MATDLRRIIHQVTNHTRKLCFDVRRNGACGPQIRDVSDLRMDIYREGKEAEDEKLLSYDFFDVTEEGRLCIVLDTQIVENCPGRYIGYLMCGCEIFDLIRFEIGCRPVVAGTAVVVESDVADCVPELGALTTVTPIIEPDQCCDPVECEAPETCCPERRCSRVVSICPDNCNDYPDLGLAKI